MESTQVSFTAKDVMQLRQKTGLGMMDCKKALTESNGDIDAAEAWLRERLKGKMDTRTERTTGEGRIGIAVDGDQAVIVEVQTETDFTARNEAFVKMVDEVVAMAMKLPTGAVEATDEIAKRIDEIRITTGENANFARGERDKAADGDVLKGICQHIVFHDPLAVDESEVSQEQIAKIRADAIQEAKDGGKNEEIAQKMSEGKVRKYLQENTLINQKFVLDESKTVKEMLPEGVKITRFVRYTLGG
jgi:elongation factor Ts